MAITHRDRQLPDWPGFMFPERWRRFFDLESEQEGWLRVEEYRDGDILVLRAEVPGIDPDKDVEITVGDGVLRFQVHRQVKEERKGKAGYRSEFHYGELTRTVRLPDGVTGDDVKATYEDGILEVRVPVPSHAEAKVTTIPVTKI